MPAATAPPRLTGDQRREQLLDAAASLLLERGPAAVTMERLAATAGVSKALPYQHFANAQAVLEALHRREVGLVAARMLAARAAVADADGPDRLRAVLGAYLDHARDRGALYVSLTTQGADRGADPGQAPAFVAALLQEDLGLTATRARAVAPVLLGAVQGALEAWAARRLRRGEVIETLIQVAQALR